MNNLKIFAANSDKLIEDNLKLIEEIHKRDDLINILSDRLNIKIRKENNQHVRNYN